MIDRIRQFFATHLSPDSASGDSQEHRLRLACAALLIEVSRADDEITAEEMAAVSLAVRKTFGLSAAETMALIQLAEEEADGATSYHEFTSLINGSYSKEQKIQLLERLWEVVFADAEMEKYEEHLVRKLADLLYVPHSQFIAAKLRTQARLQGSE
ncbi:MAG TPA: TerB family tellurite resistance protein [Gammaproteobacteria bacterium]|nr:TerB family tellurite resistance protein [Gammaproteobacteria bacterium]